MKESDEGGLPTLTLRRSGDGTGNWTTIGKITADQDSHSQPQPTPAPTTSSAPSVGQEPLDSTSGNEGTVILRKGMASVQMENVGSPKEYLESPIAEVESPKPKVESPTATGESPAAKVESPIREVESPAAKMESPTATGESPAAKVESPIGEMESPAAKMESRATKEESPIAKVGSPKESLIEIVESMEKSAGQEMRATSELVSHEQSVESSKDNIVYNKGAMVIGTAKVDIVSQSPEQKVTTGSPKSKQSRKSKMPKRSAVYTDGKIQGYVVKKSTGAKPVLTEMDKALEGVESIDTNNNSDKLMDEGEMASLGDAQLEIKVEEHLSEAPSSEISQSPHEESERPSDVKTSHDVTNGMSQDITTRRSHDIAARRSHDGKEMKSPSPMITDDNQINEDQKESLRLPLRPIFLDEIDNGITTTEQVDTSERDIDTSQKCETSQALPQPSQDSNLYRIGQNVINIVPENEPIVIKEEVDERSGASLEKQVRSTERSGDAESIEQSERPGYHLPYEDAYLEQVTSVSQQVRTLYFSISKRPVFLMAIFKFAFWALFI